METELENTARYDQLQALEKLVGKFVTYDVIKDLRSDMLGKANTQDLIILQAENAEM
jgi:hypothetical protein